MLARRAGLRAPGPPEQQAAQCGFSVGSPLLSGHLQPCLTVRYCWIWEHGMVPPTTLPPPPAAVAAAGVWSGQLQEWLPPATMPPVSGLKVHSIVLSDPEQKTSAGWLPAGPRRLSSPCPIEATLWVSLHSLLLGAAAPQQKGCPCALAQARPPKQLCPAAGPGPPADALFLAYRGSDGKSLEPEASPCSLYLLGCIRSMAHGLALRCFPPTQPQGTASAVLSCDAPPSPCCATQQVSICVVCCCVLISVPRSLPPQVYPRPNGQVYICGVSEDVAPPPRADQIAVNPEALETLRGVAASVSDDLAQAEVLQAQACFLPTTGVGDSVPAAAALHGTSDRTACARSTEHRGTARSCCGITQPSSSHWSGKLTPALPAPTAAAGRCMQRMASR